MWEGDLKVAHTFFIQVFRIRKLHGSTESVITSVYHSPPLFIIAKALRIEWLKCDEMAMNTDHLMHFKNQQVTYCNTRSRT